MSEYIDNVCFNDALVNTCNYINSLIGIDNEVSNTVTKIDDKYISYSGLKYAGEKIKEYIDENTPTSYIYYYKNGDYIDSSDTGEVTTEAFSRLSYNRFGIKFRTTIGTRSGNKKIYTSYALNTDLRITKSSSLYSNVFDFISLVDFLSSSYGMNPSSKSNTNFENQFISYYYNEGAYLVKFTDDISNPSVLASQTNTLSFTNNVLPINNSYIESPCSQVTYIYLTTGYFGSTVVTSQVSLSWSNDMEVTNTETRYHIILTKSGSDSGTITFSLNQYVGNIFDNTNIYYQFGCSKTTSSFDYNTTSLSFSTTSSSSEKFDIYYYCKNVSASSIQQDLIASKQIFKAKFVSSNQTVNSSQEISIDI